MTYEEWRAVIGFEGYEVSDMGRVRSLDRIAIYRRGNSSEPISRKHKGKILRAAEDNGHQFVVLGRGKKAWVHRLVLTAFRGPPPPGMEGCHNNGNPTINHLSNLRWDTRSNNIIDDFRSGVRQRGNISRGTIPGNSYARRTSNHEL